MTLAYLRTNLKINERIREIFVKHKVISKKSDRYVEFRLSDKIQFISLSRFLDSLNSEELGINKESFLNSKVFYDKFYFARYNSTFLSKLIEQNSSKLYLTFSKPVGNFLLAGIANADPEINGYGSFSLGLTMLFIFDNSGFIKRVLYAGAMFN